MTEEEYATNISEGKHKIALEFQAHYGGTRAKYKQTQEFEIDFKANEMYKVFIKVPKQETKDFNDNIKISFTIKGINADINNKLVLEDSFLRSDSKASQSDIQRAVTEGVIQNILITY